MTSRRSILVRALAASFAIACASLAGCAPSLPEPIQRELARSKPGEVTVVVFTDFQCPYCRRTHAKLEEVLAAREDRGRVRLVLRHVPLRSHPEARPAALAAVCAERLLPPAGAEAFVSALYRSLDLSQASLERMLVEHGGAVESYRSCLAEPATAGRLDEDRASYRASEGEGVPLLYVGRQRLDGEPTTRSIATALDAAFADAR